MMERFVEKTRDDCDVIVELSTDANELIKSITVGDSHNPYFRIDPHDWQYGEQVVSDCLDYIRNIAPELDKAELTKGWRIYQKAKSMRHGGKSLHERFWRLFNGFRIAGDRNRWRGTLYHGKELKAMRSYH